MGFTTKTHGMSGTPIYRIWINMICRCEYVKDISYHRYGGRGIRVCKAWHKFEHFYADMGDRPIGMTLDRIDNDKGYYKANCKWSTYRDQARNSRGNRLITYNNQTKPIIVWAEELSISRKVLIERFNLGWTINKAFNTPTRKWVRK